MQSNKNKPSIVLVYEQSLLRYWMERRLRKLFRINVFSNAKDALAFVRSTSELDALVTDLDLGVSTLGGCNIAREAAQQFPNARIFVFSDGLAANDHRILILRDLSTVKLLSKVEAVFLAGRLSREFSRT